MFPTIQIGPASIQTPGLIIILGLWIGIELTDRVARSQNLDSSKFYNLILGALIVAIVAARLSFFISNRTLFIDSPLSIFSLQPFMFDIPSGIGAAFIFGVIYINKREMIFWKTLDILSPLMLMVFFSISLANLASGKGFGIPTEQPWGIYLWGKSRHPTQIYEMVGIFISAWALWFLIKRKHLLVGTGQLIIVSISLISFTYLFIDYFRGDSVILYSGIHKSQIIAWVILSISLIAFHRLETIHITDDQNT